MFSYNAQTKSLISYLFPKKSVFEGQNRLLIAYENKGLKNQKFIYDMHDQVWMNDFSGQGFELDKTGSKIKIPKNRHSDGGPQIITAKVHHGHADQKWKIIKCGETEADADKRIAILQANSKSD